MSYPINTNEQLSDNSNSNIIKENNVIASNNMPVGIPIAYQIPQMLSPQQIFLQHPAQLMIVQTYIPINESFKCHAIAVIILACITPWFSTSLI